MPDELVGQIPKIERVLEALGIPVLTCEGFEADDVLATLARICDEAGANCFIVTGDKDCRQLITDRVAVYNIRKNQVFDAAALREDWGVGPDQVVDFQALVGDKVDNVPGVPGIGPKTAQTTARNVRHARQPAGTRRRSARAKGQRSWSNAARQRFLSRQLVRLDTQVPIVPDWDASRVGGMDHDALGELFAEFGFRSFAERRGATSSRDRDRAVDDRRDGELPARRYAGQARRAGRTSFRPAIADQRRHRNDARLAAVRRDRRLFVRVRAGRGVLRSRPRPGRRPGARSDATLEALCGPMLENPESARSARTSSTT